MAAQLDIPVVSNVELFAPRQAWAPIDFDEGKLTRLEGEILRVLKNHVGRTQAIKLERLGTEVMERADIWLGKPTNRDRRLRAMLKDMCKKYHLVICSTVGEPAGVYLAASADDLERFLRNLHKRSLSMLSLEATFRKVSLPELMGQMVNEAIQPEAGT